MGISSVGYDTQPQGTKKQGGSFFSTDPEDRAFLSLKAAEPGVVTLPSGLLYRILTPSSSSLSPKSAAVRCPVAPFPSPMLSLVLAPHNESPSDPMRLPLPRLPDKRS